MQRQRQLNIDIKNILVFPECALVTDIPCSIFEMREVSFMHS
jgi:hypothetical protein